MNKSYMSLFIEIGKYAGLTILIVGGLVATAAMASSSNLKSNTDIEMKATSAQLAIKSPNVNICPTSAQIAGWIHTNRPGAVSYMMAQKGGDVTGPYTIDAVKSVNGAMASFSNALQITEATDTKYRIMVSGTDGKVVSDWVPLKASCKMQLKG